MMAHNDLVSICMVTYNHEACIAQAIEGVLMQKCDIGIRLIIGDDASKDRTGDICKSYADRYPERISYFRNETNLGPALNFLQILKKSTGAYIAFCEGDDYWTDPCKLQKQITFLQENSAFNICAHQVRILMPDGRLVDDFITRTPGSESTIYDLIDKWNYMYTSAVVLRNDFIVPDWYLRCPIGDYALYLLAARHKKIRHLDDIMSVYRYGVGIHSVLPKRRMKFLSYITYFVLAKHYPDKEIRCRLSRKKNRFFLKFLYEFFFAGEGDWNDFKSITTSFFSSK